MSDDSIFGDLNRDGREDWRDDMLGMMTLEMLRRQRLEAEARERGERDRSDDPEPNWNPAGFSDASGGSGIWGLMVLFLGGLIFVGWLCSLAGR